ncbi:MAG: hypothetical protein DME44_04905 [Verrucomicrobia bacterium]|nr:MAG: hypothetical protein DME44_04905 [Verrucomicrobiota bacterium]
MIHLFRSHLSGPSAVTLGIIWQAHDSAPAVCAHLALALYLPHGRKATHQDCDFAWNGKWVQHAAHQNPLAGNWERLPYKYPYHPRFRHD